MSASAVHDGEHTVISSSADGTVGAGFTGRICFGPDAGRTQLPAELRHLGAERVLFLCSRRHAAAVRQLAQAARAAVHDVDVVVLEDADRSAGGARRGEFDAVVAVGGGVLIERAKRASAVLDVPLIALPTTYSAAELDRRVCRPSVIGQVLEEGVAPVAVVYDPCLTLTLSPRQTGLSLLGAIGAGIEVLSRAEPGSARWAFALHGLRELGRAALDTVYCPSSLTARTVVQFGAYLVGAAVAATQTSALTSACHELVDITGIRYSEARAMATLHLADTVAHTRPDVHDALLAAWPRTDPSGFVHDRAAGFGAVPHDPGPASRHVAALVCKYGV